MHHDQVEIAVDQGCRLLVAARFLDPVLEDVAHRAATSSGLSAPSASIASISGRSSKRICRRPNGNASSTRFRFFRRKGGQQRRDAGPPQWRIERLSVKVDQAGKSLVRGGERRQGDLPQRRVGKAGDRRPAGDHGDVEAGGLQGGADAAGAGQVADAEETLDIEGFPGASIPRARSSVPLEQR